MAATDNLSLESIVSTAITIPGVKVTRNSFLTECFKNEDVDIHSIIDQGPVLAGCSQELLQKKANSIIMKRTSESSAASFLAGLPGGFAMGVSIPADVLQYFAVALVLAQELSYLYGSTDLWKNGQVDMELINNQLILYCGVMFGVAGAANGVRLLSAQLAKTAAKKIPQKALTKTFWYPIVKQIGKAVGVKITKTTVANGVAKVLPVVGGVISGGITFASMMPMGKRLATTLDEANFDYTEEEINEDLRVIGTLEGVEVIEENEAKTFLKGSAEGVQKGLKDISAGAKGLFAKAQKKAEKLNSVRNAGKAEANNSAEDAFEMLEKLAALKEKGILSQEEYEVKKAEILQRI